MGHPWLWALLILLWHVGHGGADTGDDFANNLFTDLTPLLSLFGERVTMQFMSQAVGLADCLLLAMAPLGIVTIIVSAIRVAGPTWLKAIVGRARENLSVAELELMSSTSEEACELWNGRNIIRCQGSADIWQFICLVPKSSQSYEGQGVDPVIEFKTLEEVLETREEKRRGRRDEKRLMTRIPTNGPDYAYQQLKSCISRIFSLNSLTKLVSHHQPPDIERTARPESPEPQKITIIRDCGPDLSAPNLSLNCHDRVGRGELYSAAMFGALLQIGVLIFSGFITYYPSLRSSFKKDDKPVKNYAFPCAAIGTVLLAVGMFLCAVVVESSTEETSYTTTSQESEIRVVWLQKYHVANDQVFKPFAIYPRNCRPFVMISRRKDRPDKQDSKGSSTDGGTYKVTLEIITVFATAIALVGFGVQFVGLRGLDWTVSVAQLGAVVAMTIVRAVVRRGLAQPPRSSPLMSDFELDLFSLGLMDPNTAPWSGGAESDKEEINGLSYSLAVHSGRHKTDRDVIALDDIAAAARASTFEQPRRLFDAQNLVRTRKGLGDLANWRGPASDEAVRLSKAIEVIANAFLPVDAKSSFVWVLPVKVLRGQELPEKANDAISIDLKLVERRWKVDTGIIEAVMSLWMHFSQSREESSPERQTPPDRKGGDRLRSQVKQESGLRLYGSCEFKSQIERDILWWMPGATTEGFVNGSISECIRHHGISPQRIVGFGSGLDLSDCSACAPQKQYYDISSSEIEFGSDEEEDDAGDSDQEEQDDAGDRDQEEKDDDGDRDRNDNANVGIQNTHTGILALQCNDPLERLFSRDLMFSFITALAKTQETFITTVPNQDSIDFYQKKVRLHNEQFASLVRDLEKIGWGSLSDIYLDLIIPLSISQNLSSNRILIRMAQERAQNYEMNSQWRDLAQVAIWLLDLVMEMNPDRDHEYVFAVAICLDILRRIRNAKALIKAERVSEYSELSSCGRHLKYELHRRKLQHASVFFALVKIRREYWPTGLLQHVLRVTSPTPTRFPSVFKITPAHKEAMSRHLVRWTPMDRPAMRVPGLSRTGHQRDSFGWTPAHYALLHNLSGLYTGRTYRSYDRGKFHGRREVRGTRTNRPLPWEPHWSLSGVDFRGWTLTHYACRYGDFDVVARAIRSRDDLATPGNDGVTPLHCAVLNRNLRRVRYQAIAAFLQDAKFAFESQGGPKLRDCHRRSPTHWAAREGSLKWIKATTQDAQLKDNFGLTALHLAAIYGHKKVLDFLLEEAGSTKDELCGNESASIQGYSPLHLALLHSKEDIVECLINAGADVNTRTSFKATPLHFAATERSFAILIEKGAEIDAKDNEGNTSLHYAIKGNKMEVVRALIKAGADVNTTNTKTQTPLDCAIAQSSAKLYDLLRSNGAYESTARLRELRWFRHDRPRQAYPVSNLDRFA